MEYISVLQFAEKFGISERTARNYCASGKIEGAFLTGKTWNIPADAVLPQKGAVQKKVSPLLTALREQKASRLKGGIYHRTHHPFQDGNGRVGRLLMFKECLANGIVPFIISDDLKLFYYRGLREWGHINGFLADTCLTTQDKYKSLLDYFKISY